VQSLNHYVQINPYHWDTESYINRLKLALGLKNRLKKDTSTENASKSNK